MSQRRLFDLLLASCKLAVRRPPRARRLVLLSLRKSQPTQRSLDAATVGESCSHRTEHAMLCGDRVASTNWARHVFYARADLRAVPCERARCQAVHGFVQPALVQHFVSSRRSSSRPICSLNAVVLVHHTCVTWRDSVAGRWRCCSHGEPARRCAARAAGSCRTTRCSAASLHSQ